MVTYYPTFKEGNFLECRQYSFEIFADDRYCGLFRQKLKPISSNKCLGANNTLNVTIDMEQSHYCMEAVLEKNSSDGQDSNCVQCLTASASVLHIQRADGTLCVEGIATPTTNKCLRNEKELLYYTVIKREMLLEMLESRNYNKNKDIKIE